MILCHFGLVCRGGEDGFIHGSVCRPLWGRASGKKGGLLAGRLVEQQSPIVRRLGRDRAGTVAFGTFLANRSVMPEEIFAAAGSALGARAAGRRVLAIQDTTHLSFPRRAGSGLGPGGNGKVPGLFLFSTVELIEYQSVFLTRTWVDPWPKDFRVPTEYRPKRAIESTVYQKGLSEIQTGTIRQRHQGGFDRLRHHLANRPDIVLSRSEVAGEAVAIERAGAAKSTQTWSDRLPSWWVVSTFPPGG
jgi:hypothetical protein